MKSKVLAAVTAIFMLFAVGCEKKDNSGVIKSFTVKDTLQSVNGQAARVVLLYGQSNATGVASNAYLAQKDAEAFAVASSGYDNVLINYFTENGGNSSGGEFVTCKLGQAASADYFGPEVGIADVLSKTYQSETTFIIKYSWGGSALDFQWLDGNHNRGDMYFAAKAFTLTSLEYLKKKGYKPIIEAVCWMQGETDSITEDMADKYYKNTEKFVSYLKNDFKGYYENDFKFIDAGIAEIIFWTNYEKINAAKKRYADSNENRYYFSTQEMGLTTLEEPAENPDIAHYDSTSMLALGKKFGEIAVG
ncbi:MAG: hypothetical protein J5836_02255 [Clostridia bacterium]|nr:hypothetical protein [Clostridia bacterium]